MNKSSDPSEPETTQETAEKVRPASVADIAEGPPEPREYKPEPKWRPGVI